MLTDRASAAKFNILDDFWAPCHSGSSTLIPLESPFNALELIRSNHRPIPHRFGVTGAQSCRKRQKALYVLSFYRASALMLKAR